MPRMIELDGSMGEGGGQILRTSLALSLITQKPFRLFNVRAGRQKPGLQPQHLASVRAAATIGQATVCGDVVGSQEIVFEPGPVVPGKYRFAIGTAGATGLVLQTVYLPLAWKTAVPSEITLVGGTQHQPLLPLPRHDLARLHGADRADRQTSTAECRILPARRRRGRCGDSAGAADRRPAVDETRPHRHGDRVQRRRGPAGA